MNKSMDLHKLPNRLVVTYWLLIVAAAILAAGAIADRPVGVSGQLVLQPTLNLTLAIDHRVADGAQGAQFLSELRELLEAPARLMNV